MNFANNRVMISLPYNFPLIFITEIKPGFDLTFNKNVRVTICKKQIGIVYKT